MLKNLLTNYLQKIFFHTRFSCIFAEQQKRRNMGGFTAVYLKDTSEENIRKQNQILTDMKVSKKYRFYSIADVEDEYIYYKKGLGNYPPHLFPKETIHSFSDFQKYWNPEAIGEVFCPHIGSLTFDCYFGRTSLNAMRGIAKYLLKNSDCIFGFSGSYETFFERSMTEKEIGLITIKMNSNEIKEI